MLPSEAYELICRARQRIPFLLGILNQMIREGVSPWERDPTPNAWIALNALACASLEGSLYVWSPEMLRLLVELAHSFPLDTHLQAEDLLTRTGCWVFSAPPCPDTRMLSFVTVGEEADSSRWNWGIRLLEWMDGGARSDGLPLPLSQCVWPFRNPMKGPEDKPLKAEAARVFAVNR